MFTCQHEFNSLKKNQVSQCQVHVTCLGLSCVTKVDFFFFSFIGNGDLSSSISFSSANYLNVVKAHRAAMSGMLINGAFSQRETPLRYSHRFTSHVIRCSNPPPPAPSPTPKTPLPSLKMIIITNVCQRLGSLTQFRQMFKKKIFLVFCFLYLVLF